MSCALLDVLHHATSLYLSQTSTLVPTHNSKKTVGIALIVVTYFQGCDFVDLTTAMPHCVPGAELVLVLHKMFSKCINLAAVPAQSTCAPVHRKTGKICMMTSDGILYLMSSPHCPSSVTEVWKVGLCIIANVLLRLQAQL